MIVPLKQTPKLSKVATKAPSVGRAAPCQSNDWLGAKKERFKNQLLEQTIQYI
jgi:hypothetical protein